MYPQPAAGDLEATTRQFFPNDELGIVAAFKAGGAVAATRVALGAVASSSAVATRLKALAVLAQARLAPSAGCDDQLVRIAHDPVSRVRLALQWYLRRVIEDRRQRGRE